MLSDEEKEVAKSVIEADASMGIVRNIISKRAGQIVSLNACHYLSSLGTDLKRIRSLDGLNTSNCKINFFQEKNMMT